jgi:hypothetical protein
VILTQGFVFISRLKRGISTNGRSSGTDASKSCNLDQAVVSCMQTDRRQTLAHFGLVVQFIFALLQFENGSCVHTLSVATTISNTERNSPFVLLFVFESKLSGRCNVVEYKYYSNIHGYISVVTVELIVLRSFGF